jgi:D-amino peptidase
MRVYISIDMEGLAGVATRDQIVRGGHGYPAAQALMTQEANAAIEGAFAGGAREVVVNDSHGTMDNLLQERLDPRARLVLGAPKLDCMAEGISAEHDVAFFIGYHAAAGGPGVLAHTFSSHLTEVRLNGAPASEAEVNALQAAAVGVPIGLLSGDDVVCRAALAAFPGVSAVEVKQARGVYAAISLSPTEARTLIRDAATRAVTGHGALRPVEIPEALDVEVDMPSAVAAENGSMMPGVERVADRTLRFSCLRPRDVVGFVMLCSQLAETAMRKRYQDERLT